MSNRAQEPRSPTRRSGARTGAGERTGEGGRHDAVTGLSELVGRLRQDIVDARLAADEPLRFRSLCDTYGASVSTLREALSRLAGEDLVDFQPNQGFRVATVSRQDLIEIMEASSRIESVALRRSIEQGDDHWEAEIVAAHHRLVRVQGRLGADAADGASPEGAAATAAEWEVRHRAFHQSLVAGCRSRWLIKFCDQLRVQFDRYRHLVNIPPADHPNLVAHHQPLMEAALARDADEACRLIAEHFEECAKMILARIHGRKGGALSHLAGTPQKVSPNLDGRREGHDGRDLYPR